METVSIFIDHDDPRIDNTDICEGAIEVEFELEFEPADPSVGYFTDSWDANYDFVPPDTCSECGHVYTVEEKAKLEKELAQAVKDYQPEIGGPPEPDDDAMWEYERGRR